jgi:hypothetical protein
LAGDAFYSGRGDPADERGRLIICQLKVSKPANRSNNDFTERAFEKAIVPVPDFGIVVDRLFDTYVSTGLYRAYELRVGFSGEAFHPRPRLLQRRSQFTPLFCKKRAKRKKKAAHSPIELTRARYQASGGTSGSHPQPTQKENIINREGNAVLDQITNENEHPTTLKYTPFASAVSRIEIVPTSSAQLNKKYRLILTRA